MTSYLSLKFLKTSSVSKFELLAVTLSLILSSCSLFKTNDYSVKDSLYVWSDSYDSEILDDQATVEYQPLSLVLENLLKTQGPAETLAILTEDIPKGTGMSKNIDMSATKEVAKSNAELQITHDEMPLDTQVIEQSTNITPVVVSELVESDVSEASKTNDQAMKENATVKQVADNSPLESVQDVNRLTSQNPTAAGIPVSQVIPDVNINVTDIELPNEILLLASQSEYREKVDEFGMWQLVRGNRSPHHEVCTLSTSTLQLDQGNYTTQVWFNVVGSALLVNSTTNIDVKKPNVGIKFDNLSLQPFSKNYFNTSAVWSGDLDGALKQNKVLNVSIGGNELGQNTQGVSMDLRDLKKAYSAYRQCNRGTQIGSL